MPPDYELELFKSCLSLIVAALTLSATWFIGQRLTAYWNFRESEMSSICVPSNFSCFVR
jgi:hypothetical protein